MLRNFRKPRASPNHTSIWFQVGTVGDATYFSEWRVGDDGELRRNL